MNLRIDPYYKSVTGPSSLPTHAQAAEIPNDGIPRYFGELNYLLGLGIEVVYDSSAIPSTLFYMYF